MAREFTRTALMEYRGLARKAGEFNDQETGAKVEYGELVQFEYDEDGVTKVEKFRLSEFDTADGSIDLRSCQKGDLLNVTLRLVAYQKADGTRSWFEAVDHVEVAKRPKLAAA